MDGKEIESRRKQSLKPVYNNEYPRKKKEGKQREKKT
jgi:hypothetical protein